MGDLHGWGVRDMELSGEQYCCGCNKIGSKRDIFGLK